MSPRILLRLAVAFTLAASLVVAGFPGAGPSVAAPPPTVVRTLAVSTRALAPHGGEGRLRLEDGRLTAVVPGPTGRAEVCAPIWFTALGLTWDQSGGAPSTATVSVSRDGREFGRERSLEAEGGPDPGSQEFHHGVASSSLLWTGGGSCVRVAFELAAGASIGDVRVFVINASGSSRGPGTGPPNIDVATSPTGFFAAAPAGALTQRPNFITRRKWGARKGLLNCKPAVADEVWMGFIHHTAGTNHYSRAKADDIIRSIYAYHTKALGWCDIAYNFLVDKYGRAYEGRSGGMTEPVIGAAQQGFNTRAFSVSLMGTFSRHRPRHAMMRTLRKVLAWRLDVAHVPPKGRAEMVSGGGSNTRYKKGEHVNLPVISLHRTTGYTDCPGSRVAHRVDETRRKVNRMGHPKIYRPDLEPRKIDVGSDEMLIRAGGSRPLEWSVSVHDGGTKLFDFPSKSGEKLQILWEKNDPSTPYPGSPGSYTLQIRAEGGSGKPARAAELEFVIND